MLTIGKLAAGQQAYYLQQVAHGAEEYYTGAKEAPGQWLGRGAELLGLSGEVPGEDLGRVLRHGDPHTGADLTGGRSAPKVAGFDATFSAPKSVSLLYALGDPETSNVVRNAHDAALRAAFGFYEQQASLVRRGHGGEVVERGDGLVAAAFRHRTSRAGDPQLHTHVVIANVAHSPSDGRWSALFAQPGIYRWARPVGHLYQAQLRWELTCALGVDWSPVTNGAAEIRGFSRDQLRAFSNRRVEIEAHLEAHGETSARAAQLAAYATRPTKDPNATPDNLHDTWRAGAARVGLDDRAMASTLDRRVMPLAPAVDSIAAHRLYNQLAGPEGLTRTRSIFGRGEVIVAICDALPHGAPTAKVLALADRFLEHPQVIPLTVGDVEPVRWTTVDMIDTERALLDRVERCRDADVARTPPAMVEDAIAVRPHLSADQQHMVRRLCLDGAGITTVAGLAGAGKTTALAAAVQAWTGAGCRVTGVALAARTAHGLEDATAAPSMSIARYLHGLDTGTIIVGRDDVVVVDEAGMVGTRTLNRLASRCEQAAAKLVLVGDPYQLPELEAGGAFARLTGAGDAVELRANRRQREPWEVAALDLVRTGDTSVALELYDTHGRIHQADTLADARRQLVADWHNARAAGADVVMIAVTNRDVDALNNLARVGLQTSGQLDPDVIEANGRRFAVGDEVMALRNEPHLGVYNGTRATIVAIDTTGRTVTVDIGAPADPALPFGYVADGGLSHAYAVTLHKAQGATVDQAFILARDGLPREHAYTALSRGRDSNRLYIADPERRSDIAHTSEVSDPVGTRLERQLQRSVAQHLAHDHIATAHARHQLQAALANRTWPPIHEADAITAAIGPPPPDRSGELRAARERLHSEQHSLEQARWREQRALDDLDKLGPISRRLYSRQRRDAEMRLGSARTDIDRRQQACLDITTTVSDLEPAVEHYHAWCDQHQPALERLHEIHRERTLLQTGQGRTIQPGRDSLQRGLDRGIDLGL